MRRDREKAFTLVEALVGSMILAVTLGFMYGTYFAGNDLWQSSAESIDLDERCRIALNRISDELKSATRTSTQNPSPNFHIASANEAHVYLPRDIDGDGLPTDAGGGVEWDTNSQIKYQYIPGQRQLRRLEGASQDVIAGDVASIRFVDASIDPTVPLTEVRVTLVLEAKTPRGRSISCARNTSVKLRN